VNVSIYLPTSFAARPPELNLDQHGVPEYVRKGYSMSTRKNIEGFRDVNDGEFKAFGSALGSRFDPDTLYRIRADGNIAPVDKKTVIGVIAI